MKNPFTQLGNKFTMTVDRVRQTIFRQRQKDAGTKKETHRGKGGGGSVKTHLDDRAFAAAIEKRKQGEYIYVSQESRATLRRARRIIMKNKMAARSRRINRIKRQNGKAA